MTPSVSDLNRLLDPSYKTPKQGYAVLDGSTTYVQNSMFFPGVTAEMFRWWFTWHPIEKERYMLWFPQAHIDNSVQDRARLANTGLSYEDRLYDNPNRVVELVGPQAMELLIRFTDPAKLGFDPKRIQTGRLHGKCQRHRRACAGARCHQLHDDPYCSRRRRRDGTG